MKILYLDCSMGAAGDMLMGALYELCPDKQRFLEAMNALVPLGVTVQAIPDSKRAVTGTHMRVLIHGQEEHAGDHHTHEGHHPHDHEHTHDREHHHGHHTMADITAIIGELALPETVRENALAVYQEIAAAESTVHGTTVEQIHFHEVGTLDAVADVVGVCLLMDMLSPDRVEASPVHVGNGQVRCAHGLMPVPAPATALLLRGIPCYGGTVEGELCTPTGAALLRRFVQRFGPMPLMAAEQIGYGMGTKDFAVPNCVRAFWGTAAEEPERVSVIACNLDDMTGEAIGAAMDALLAAGALDVFTTAIGMKKNRPGTMLTCICKPADESRFAALMLENTTTLGVRITRADRQVLTRRMDTVSVQGETVAVKVSEGPGIRRIKPESDQVAAFAEKMGISYLKAREIIRSAIAAGEGEATDR